MEAIQLWKSKQRSRDFESGRNNSISHDSGRVITPLLRLCAFSLTHVSSHVFLVFIVPCLYNLLPWGWTVMNFNTEDETTVISLGVQNSSVRESWSFLQHLIIFLLGEKEINDDWPYLRITPKSSEEAGEAAFHRVNWKSTQHWFSGWDSSLQLPCAIHLPT